MAVSERDRAYMRAIAESKRTEKADQFRETARTTPGERIRAGFALAGRARIDAATEKLLSERALGQVDFYRRWRRRGKSVGS